MPVEFNPKALDVFRNAKLDNENAIANMDGNNAIKGHGIYKGGIRVLFRSGDEKRANNEVRTQLLQSLGKAFGINSCITTDKNGTVIFSKDFMDKLEKILGPEFKRDDFGIGDKGGAVSGGRPLTQRRITAIINKAALVGKTEYDYATYKVKLNYIKDKIANLELTETQEYLRDAANRHFNTVAKLMDFILNELDGLIEENYLYDPRNEDEPRLLFNTRLDGHYEQKPLESIGMVTTYIQLHVGELFHIQENILGDKSLARFEDLKEPEKQIPDYIKRAATAFIAASIDIFMDSENAGKLVDFLSELSGSWPCIEGKTSGLIEFKINNIPMDDAGPIATHDNDQNLDLCIGREISAMVNENSNLSEWKDFAPTIKKNLVGVTRPITKPVKVTTQTKEGETLQSWKFVPVLDNNNKQVVRPITEKDIDDLGEACLDVIFEG